MPSMRYSTHGGGFGTPGRLYESNVCGGSMAVVYTPPWGRWFACYRRGLVDIGARAGSEKVRVALK
jgi:hypothetical protein